MKRTVNRLLALLLSAILLFSFAPSGFAEGANHKATIEQDYALERYGLSSGLCAPDVKFIVVNDRMVLNGTGHLYDEIVLDFEGNSYAYAAYPVTMIPAEDAQTPQTVLVEGYYQLPSAFTRVKQIFLNDGIRSIGLFSFYRFEALESIFIPSSVTFIGILAFSGCAALNTVLFEGNSEEWERLAADVVLPEKTAVICIGDGASLQTNRSILHLFLIPVASMLGELLIIVSRMSFDLFRASPRAWFDAVKRLPGILKELFPGLPLLFQR